MAKVRRSRIAIILLTVYLLAVGMASFHWHHAESADAVVACDDCSASHRSHSGHWNQPMLVWHDCLLCQFLSSLWVPMLAAVVLSVAFFGRTTYHVFTPAVVQCYAGYVLARGPPRLPLV
ncbi:MAG: hypothetical protein IJ620_05725 [Bacteroidales bacterium]|nr:hypothetical protein [Bacteroidales bacterium]